MADTINIVYLAWIREAMGRSEEQVSVPKHVRTINDLVDHLGRIDTGFANIVKNETKIRFALDQVFAKPDAPIGDSRELAIFPPVTGG